MKVTPRGAGLKVEPVELPLKIGSRVRIRFRYGLIPINWELSIKSLKQGDRFIDWQEKGPFKEWRHTHLFSRTGNMTTVVDMVEYELPYGFFGPLLNALVIRPAIANYFGYRQRKLVEIFGAEGVEAKGEARRGREERGGRDGRGERGERGKRGDRDREGRPARGERSERPERGERGARTERAPGGEREERPDREGRGPRGERRERGERGGRGRGRGGRDRGGERGGRERDDQGGERERERGRNDAIRDSGATGTAGAAKAPGVRRPTTEAGGEWVDEHLSRAAGKILEREKRERLRDREGAEIDDGETVRPRRPATEEFAGGDDARGSDDQIGDDGTPRRRRRRGGRGRRGRTRGAEGREGTPDAQAPWAPEGARGESGERPPRSDRASFADDIADDDAGRDDNGDEALQAAPRREPRDTDAVRAPRGEDFDAGADDAVGAVSEPTTREPSERGGRRDDGRRDREGGRRERGGRERGGRDRGDRGGSRGGGGSFRRRSSGDDDRDIDGEAPEREKPRITPIYFPGTSFTADDEAWSSAPPATPPLPGDSPEGAASLILPGPRRPRTWGRGPQRVPVRAPAPAAPKPAETSRAHETPASPESIESSTENT
ncbi:MAG: SRPBCC family protein [bacterium]